MPCNKCHDMECDSREYGIDGDYPAVCEGSGSWVIFNMTPHPVNIIGGETFPKCETPLRLSVSTVADMPIAGVPTSKTVYGECIGLPEYQDGVFYIVSQLVKSALPNRTDLLVPAEVVRDEKGNIVGCKSLGR